MKDDPRDGLTRDCANGLHRIAHLIAAALEQELTTALDWGELRPYAIELMDGAIEEAGMDPIAEEVTT